MRTNFDHKYKVPIPAAVMYDDPLKNQAGMDMSARWECIRTIIMQERMRRRSR